MNRLWAAGVIIVLLVILCITGLRVTNSYADDMSQTLYEIKTEMQNGNTEHAYQESQKMLVTWEKYHKNLSMYIPHARLESIDQALTALPPPINYGVNDQFEAEYNRASLQIDRLKDTELPTLENFL